MVGTEVHRVQTALAACLLAVGTAYHREENQLGPEGREVERAFHPADPAWAVGTQEAYSVAYLDLLPVVLLAWEVGTQEAYSVAYPDRLSSLVRLYFQEA